MGKDLKQVARGKNEIRRGEAEPMGRREKQEERKQVKERKERFGSTKSTAKSREIEIEDEDKGPG